MLCTSSGCENAKNSRTCSDVKYDFIFEVFRVIFNGLLVSASACTILKHLFVDIEVGIASVVVVVVFFAVEVSKHALLESHVYEQIEVSKALLPKFSLDITYHRTTLLLVQ